MDLDAFSTNTLIVAAAAVLLSIYRLSQQRKNSPPGPWSWPVVGHLLRFYGNPKVHLELEKMAKPYGPVMRIKLGSQDAIVLTGYDVMKEAMIDKAEQLSERPCWINTIRGLDRETGVAFNPNWNSRRRFTLISMRGFGLGKRSLEERIQEEAGYLCQAISDANGGALDMSTITPYTSANIICSICIGHRFNYGDPELINLLGLFSRITRGTGNFSLQNFLPFKWLLPSGDFKSTKAGIDGVNAKTEKLYQEHLMTFDSSNIRDVIDLFIEEERKNPDAFGKMDLVNTISELFIAGTETTSITLCWALLHVMKYPDIQKRCRDDIHAVLGFHKVAEYEDIKKLPYINAVIYEVQRITNIAPLGLWHSTLEEVELAGYTIPKDTIVLPNIYTSMRDPKYWTEPAKFNPDRWLDHEGKMIKNPAWMPYFIGKRICLGAELAKKELFIFFTTMLQRFTFSAADGTTLPTLEAAYGVIQAPQKFQVKAVPV